MGETKHRYVIRYDSENGKAVSAELQRMATDGKLSFEKLETAAVKVDGRFSMLARTALTQLIPAFSAGALIYSIRGAIKEMGDLKDAADKVGISAEKLQVFRLIGEDAGLAVESSDAALTKFIRNIGDAHQGVGKLADVLKY